MKNSIFILALLIFILPSNAQSNLITLDTENGTNGSIAINANSLAATRYTIKIDFRNLTGFLTYDVSNPFIDNVGVGRTQILKLTPDKSAVSRSLNYSYSYYAGIAFRKTPTNYKHYLLPVSAGKKTTITKVESINDMIGQKSASNFYTQGFTYKLGDTICATRAGYVYNINDQLTQGEASDVVFKDNRNKIFIEHKDGTLGYYTILSPIKCLVTNGEFVIPGQPIAIFNTESEKYRIFFSVYYLDEEKVKSINSKEVYNALPTYFYLNQDTNSTLLLENHKYESVKSIEIITEELNKKEKKKFGYLN